MIVYLMRELAAALKSGHRSVRDQTDPTCYMLQGSVERVMLISLYLVVHTTWVPLT